MFLVGLELDVSSIRKNGGKALLISHTSIIFPFFLGSFTGVDFHPQLSNNSVSFLKFCNFYWDGDEHYCVSGVSPYFVRTKTD